MKIEDAYEEQRVRVKDVPHESHAGQEGVIIQIWRIPDYKWHEWATVEFANGNIEHIEYEHLDAVSKEQEA